MPLRFAIYAGRDSDRDWCARLMAANEPWRTLGLGLELAHALLLRPGCQFFVARQGRRRLGFIVVEPYGFAGSPYIAALAVEEGERAKGIGSELVAFVEERFTGRRHLFLSVPVFDQRVERLCRRLGYERVAELPDHVTDGRAEVVLRKKLS